MLVPLRSTLVFGSAAALACLAACAPDSSTGPLASRGAANAVGRSGTLSVVSSSLPSGERRVGQTSIEPAYDDVTGGLVYLLTPMKSPFPTKANSHAVAPLYLVEYPPGTTVGTLNCMGVPGNCPDHDLEVATAATQIMPSVYGTDPTAVPGHDHLVAPPGSGGDFNVAWEVIEVLFTSKAAASTHITTKAELDAAIARGDAIAVDLGFAFTCAVVSPTVYYRGTPVL